MFDGEAVFDVEIVSETDSDLVADWSPVSENDGESVPKVCVMDAEVSDDFDLDGDLVWETKVAVWVTVSSSVSEIADERVGR